MSQTATIVRNVLMIGSREQGGGSRLCLLDVAGRKVMELKPGENDIRHLSPGVYFVHQEANLKGYPTLLVKVVITR